MRASADAVALLRRRCAEILGNEMTVAEWEIALLHRMHNSGDGACVRCTWAARGGRQDRRRNRAGPQLDVRP